MSSVLSRRIGEKDYILGWVLAGIYRDPSLAWHRQ
jgi:hypothetical protein